MSQITAGALAKTFLAYSDAQGEPITLRRCKKYVDKWFPSISTKELYERTRKVFAVTEQLKRNGWLESEECKVLKRLDAQLFTAMATGQPLPLPKPEQTGLRPAEKYEFKADSSAGRKVGKSPLDGSGQLVGKELVATHGFKRVEYTASDICELCHCAGGHQGACLAELSNQVQRYNEPE